MTDRDGPRGDAPTAPDETRLTAPIISLALQGGASLGAYTWGVLDAILEDGRVAVEGLTGASAGAINAAAFGSGFTTGGRQGARDAMQGFWEGLARAAQKGRRRRFDLMMAVLGWLPRIRSSEAFYALTTRLAADFHMDPKTMEPLRGALRDNLDLSVLGRPDALKVFVNATDVQTGHPEVFSGGEIDVDAVCASCAVPLLFEPVAIRGRWYWDGGLIGNPAIYPVIYGCQAAKDVVLVETRSDRAVSIPKTAADVMSRTMELASTAGLVRELRMIKFVTQIIREQPRPGLREIRLHRIPAHRGLADLSGARSFRADVPYFHTLRDLGREAGRAWLDVALAGAGADESR